MIDFVLVFFVYGTTAAAIIFPFLYAARSNWRKYLVGRALMQLSIALAVILSLNSFSLVTGSDFAGRDAVRFFAFLFLFVSMWRQVYVLFRVQNEQHDDIRRERARVPEDVNEGRES